jgi:hypothetical protein
MRFGSTLLKRAVSLPGRLPVKRCGIVRAAHELAHSENDDACSKIADQIQTGDYELIGAATRQRG